MNHVRNLKQTGTYEIERENRMCLMKDVLNTTKSLVTKVLCVTPIDNHSLTIKISHKNCTCSIQLLYTIATFLTGQRNLR